MSLTHSHLVPRMKKIAQQVPPSAFIDLSLVSQPRLSASSLSLVSQPRLSASSLSLVSQPCPSGSSQPCLSFFSLSHHLVSQPRLTAASDSLSLTSCTWCRAGSSWLPAQQPRRHTYAHTYTLLHNLFVSFPYFFSSDS